MSDWLKASLDAVGCPGWRLVDTEADADARDLGLSRAMRGQPTRRPEPLPGDDA